MTPNPDLCRRELLRLLRSSAKPAATFEPLGDIASRAGLQTIRVRDHARELVAAGYWGKAGRAEDTTYALTPKGRAHLAAQHQPAERRRAS